ncbi:MAG: elongation factor Ts [bacterium]|nr:elongation factor Ts [bacterium]
MSDIEKIKKIRETTGLSVGEISKAMREAEGDEAKMLEILKSRGVVIADKKSSREIKEGVIESYIHNTKKVGALLSLGSETDFVARNAEFQKLAHDLAMQVASMCPQNVEELLAQPFIKDPSVTVTDLINQHIAKLGENIRVGQFVRFEI